MSRTITTSTTDRLGPARRRLRPRLAAFIPALIAVVGLVAVGIAVAATADPKSFYYPLGVFSYVMSSTGLPLAYPLIAVAVFVLPFSERLRQRQLFYSRLRAPLTKQLWVASGFNALTAFAVFFVFTFVVFCFVNYLLPTFPSTVFDTFEPGSYRADFELARMTELMKVSPLVFGLSYAAWSGINGAIWATFGMVAVLVFKNRFVAIAAPVIAFIVVSFVFSTVGSPFVQNTPWTLWVLFGIAQIPFASAAIILSAFAVLSFAALAITLARAERLETLQ